MKPCRQSVKICKPCTLHIVNKLNKMRLETDPCGMPGDKDIWHEADYNGGSKILLYFYATPSTKRRSNVLLMSVGLSVGKSVDQMVSDQ